MANTHFSGPVVSAGGFVGALTGNVAGAVTNAAATFNTLAATPTITAGTTQTQAGATLLTSAINYVSTVTSAGDGVRLPASAAGRVVYVANPSANSVQVYGLGTDTINNVATATGVAQAAGKHAIYFCAAAGNWSRVLSA